MKLHSIGRASEMSGVKVTTIRFYEENGLMPEPDRTASGRRIYDDARIDQLRFIRHARDLGFPVDSVRGLIRLQQQPGDDCATADRLATSHLQEVRDRIRQLRALEEELERMISSCKGGAIAQCQIMASLGDHGKCSGEH